MPTNPKVIDAFRPNVKPKVSPKLGPTLGSQPDFNPAFLVGGDFHLHKGDIKIVRTAWGMPSATPLRRETIREHLNWLLDPLKKRLPGAAQAWAICLRNAARNLYWHGGQAFSFVAAEWKCAAIDTPQSTKYADATLGLQYRDHYYGINTHTPSWDYVKREEVEPFQPFDQATPLEETEFEVNKRYDILLNPTWYGNAKCTEGTPWDDPNDEGSDLANHYVDHFGGNGKTTFLKWPRKDSNTFWLDEEMSEDTEINAELYDLDPTPFAWWARSSPYQGKTPEHLGPSTIRLPGGMWSRKNAYIRFWLLHTLVQHCGGTMLATAALAQLIDLELPDQKQLSDYFADFREDGGGVFNGPGGAGSVVSWNPCLGKVWYTGPGTTALLVNGSEWVDPVSCELLTGLPFGPGQGTDEAFKEFASSQTKLSPAGKRPDKVELP